MARRFSKPAPRILNRNRMDIARDQLARTTSPLTQQSIAAEQRSISDDEYLGIVHNQF